MGKLDRFACCTQPTSNNIQLYIQLSAGHARRTIRNRHGSKLHTIETNDTLAYNGPKKGRRTVIR